MGSKRFVDHLPFEIDGGYTVRRRFVVGGQKASGTIEIVHARNEGSVGDLDLGRVDTQLPYISEIAGRFRLSPKHNLVAEVRDDLIDDRDSGKTSGEHGPGSGVGHLEVGRRADASHVGDVVLGSEVRADDARVGQERSAISYAQSRFEAGEDTDVVEPGSIHGCRGTIQVAEIVDLGDHDSRCLGGNSGCDVVVEPGRGDRVDTDDHRASGGNEVRDSGPSRRPCFGLGVGGYGVLAIDEKQIGAPSGELGQEIGPNSGGNEHGAHAAERSEGYGHRPIVPDPGGRHEYGSRMSVKTTRTPPRTALVTGASSGIGAATTRVLAGAGWHVVAAARRRDRLEALAEETGCVPITLDVTDAGAVRTVGQSEPFDLVVNNAGLGRAMGAIWEASDDDVERTIETNVTGLVNMTRAVLPGMIERGRGHIVNVSSVLALYPGPAALYGATKGAVRLLSQDLRQELRGTGIRITEICPGRVATEFYDVALDDPAAVAAAKDTGIQDITPDDVAQAILYAVSAPWRVNVSTIEIVPTEQTYGGAQFTPVHGVGATRTVGWTT